MVDFLNYTISEKNYNKKINPYLKKLSKVMKSKLNEYYDFNNKVITRERQVTHYLYDGTEINALLDKNKNMIITLTSCKDRKLMNNLEKLAIK